MPPMFGSGRWSLITGGHDGIMVFAWWNHAFSTLVMRTAGLECAGHKLLVFHGTWHSILEL